MNSSLDRATGEPTDTTDPISTLAERLGVVASPLLEQADDILVARIQIEAVLKEDQQFVNAANALWNDAALRSRLFIPSDSTDTTAPIEFGLYSQLAYLAMVMYRDGQFSAGEVESVLRVEAAADVVPYVAVGALWNVEIPSGAAYDIGGHVRIRELTEDERIQFIQFLQMQDHFAAGHFERPCVAIEASYEQPKGGWNEDANHLQEWFANVVTILRLLNDQPAVLVGTRIKQGRLTHLHGGGGTLIGGGSRIPPADNHIVLNEDSVAEVERLYCALRQLRQSASGKEAQRLHFGLQRFNTTYSRHAEDDKLVDCWVGLESLLLPDGSTELRYRIALRAAVLLEEAVDERHALQGRILKLYDHRSEVVHGDKVADPTKVSETTSILKRLLLLVIENRIPTKDDLDRIALGESFIRAPGASMTLRDAQSGQPS